MQKPKKVSLGFFPTPIEKLENLSKKFNTNIFVKRDDQTGLAFGGNKTRKLEFLIADALEHHSKAVITEGAAQSNHVRQTAAAAVKFGLKPHLILYKPEPENYTGNLFLDTLFDAKIHWISKENAYEERLKVIGVLKDCYGQAPYYIPVGGSNEIGLWGYVSAVEEIKRQSKDLNINFDYIVFASSSGGTQSGLILGKKIYNLDSQIIGIEIDKNFYGQKTLKQHIKNILTYAQDDFQLNISIADEDIQIISDYNEAGYGQLTEQEAQTIKLVAQTEGLLLDPVYTSRAFTGLLDLIEKNYFKKNSNILFIHTGGTPALFAYTDKLFKKIERGKDNENLLNEIL